MTVKARRALTGATTTRDTIWTSELQTVAKD
jgi:hypothetical protein